MLFSGPAVSEAFATCDSEFGRVEFLRFSTSTATSLSTPLFDQGPGRRPKMENRCSGRSQLSPRPRPKA